MANRFIGKRNRYGNVSKRTKCAQGHHHPSKLESDYCDMLHLLKKNGDIKDVECQKTFRLEINGVLICRHRPDFVVTNKDGKKEVHETKGFETDIWRFKKKLFEALYPELPYIVIK